MPRCSSTYKISGTKTFRLASCQILPRDVFVDGKKKSKGWGANMQNWEKSLRKMFVPDLGMILVQVDQSGAEALIVAYLCRDGNFRKLFINGIKPHVFVALHIFKDIWEKKLREASVPLSDNFSIDDFISMPIEKLKSHQDWHSLDNIIKDSDNWSLEERYYYLAKQACHSGNYGITPPTFRLNVLEKSGGKIVVSKEDSEKFIETYNNLFPEIREWHSEVRRQVEDTHCLYNLHGHPYQITNYTILESAWKELYAWIPQSTVGMITNIAYARLQEWIETNGRTWDLLANTHDSYLVQCPIGEEQEAASVMREFINQEFTSPVDGVKFRMKSEAVAGFNWMPYKKEVNELGLREIK